jgi:hypothetical protein
VIGRLGLCSRAGQWQAARGTRWRAHQSQFGLITQQETSQELLVLFPHSKGGREVKRREERLGWDRQDIGRMKRHKRERERQRDRQRKSAHINPILIAEAKYPFERVTYPEDIEKASSHQPETKRV